MKHATVVLIAVCCAFLAVPSQAGDEAPTNPVKLLALKNKPAASLTFQPLGAKVQPLLHAGRPLVIIAFASWCGGCIQEMPRNLRDFVRFHDRVDFVGIDYTESPATAAQMVATYKIPFPVESYVPPGTSAIIATPAPPGSVHTSTSLTMHVPGGVVTSAILGSMKKQMPPNLYEKVAQIAVAQAAHESPAAIAALEDKLSVHVSDLDQAAPAGPPQGQTEMLSLPYTFVIDAGGVVRASAEGYSDSIDPIVVALAELGLH